jgi:hypothetical protein
MKAANLNFFATEADQKTVVDFLFSSTDVRVFESYSEPGQNLREFHSTEELIAAFPLGSDKYGNGVAVLLQLWSPSVMKELVITKFGLDPTACDGHTFRYRIDGGALIQLYFGGVHEHVITLSHFGHQSQIRAQKWDVDNGINWDSLKTLSNKIQYHIRKRLAVAKVPGCPILPQAYELACSGYSLKWVAQSPWAYEVPTEPNVASSRKKK